MTTQLSPTLLALLSTYCGHYRVIAAAFVLRALELGASQEAIVTHLQEHLFAASQATNVTQ
jgi:hypothetical protein